MLWGASELIFGTWLHMLRVPFKGTLLTALGIWIILTGLKFIPGRAAGSLVSMGIICASVKFLSLGMVPKPNIYMSIIMEACLAELGIIAAGRTRKGYILAGALAILWPPISKVFVAGMILGKEYMELFSKTGITSDMVSVSIIVMLLHLFAGAAAGFAAWQIKYED